MTITLSEQPFVPFSNKIAASTIRWRLQMPPRPWNKSKQLSPNLAVVDFSMPEMNGLQLARELKARQPALPIFMLTANYDADIEKEALAFGITAVFSKLDDLTTLIANARVVCGLE